jgi:Flp pilus assembly protein TadG
MQLNRRKRRLGRRGSISVELALTVVFILFPLLAGGADFLELMTAKAQMNTALEGFYAYAWNNPGDATDVSQLSGILSAINQQSLPQITFPDGRADSSTSYQPVVTYQCRATPTANPTTQSTPCPSGNVQQASITYSVATKVVLPVPLPFGLSSPYPLSAIGEVQVQ